MGMSEKKEWGIVVPNLQSEVASSVKGERKGEKKRKTYQRSKNWSPTLGFATNRL